jgi:hypothetical protein
MPSFGYGPHTFNADSIEEGLAIGKTLENLVLFEYQKKILRELKHGHDFGRNRVCKCGMRLRDYYLSDWSDPTNALICGLLFREAISMRAAHDSLPKTPEEAN